jgi:hypothetical protein
MKANIKVLLTLTDIRIMEHDKDTLSVRGV